VADALPPGEAWSRRFGAAACERPRFGGNCSVGCGRPVLAAALGGSQGERSKSSFRERRREDLVDEEDDMIKSFGAAMLGEDVASSIGGRSVTSLLSRVTETARLNAAGAEPNWFCPD